MQMQIDKYSIERDQDFPCGEQYWVYKDTKLMGWVRFSLGILRVAHCATKTSLASPFLFHECYGDGCADEFSTGKERRAALRKAITLLEKYYKDSPDSLLIIAKAFPGTVVDQSQEQLTIFKDLFHA